MLGLLASTASGQEPHRFTRTPYLTGTDDSQQGQIRRTIKLAETVVIEIPGGFDGILEPGVVPELSERRYSRRGGPFEIEDVKPGGWLAIHIIDVVPDPTATATTADLFVAACARRTRRGRCLALPT